MTPNTTITYKTITYKKGPWNNFDIKNLSTYMITMINGPRQRKLIEQKVGRTYFDCVKKYKELLGIQNHRRIYRDRVRHIRNNRQNEVGTADNITIPPTNTFNHGHRNPIMEWSYILNDDSCKK